MATVGPECDAGFFSLIHHLVTQAERDRVSDNRETARRTFSLVQWIAPGYNWRIPPATAWIEVRCHDLTPAGIAFYLPKPPDFQRLVVMLGRPPDVMHVMAQVAHWRPIEIESAGRRNLGVLVGCRFVRRLDRTAAD